ncbi:MAG: VOC family protein [Candidatus Latescibacteria bacterium]|nr:VOC family protein [Candidatus Latescibacterota bacterium]
MASQLEHANLTVRDMSETLNFLTTALPDFKVRGQGDSGQVQWLHVGTDSSYITLNQASDPNDDDWARSGRAPGFNHLGFIVDDAEAVQRRLEEAGYQVSSAGEDHPYRKRVYFRNQEGVEWEFIQYLSDDPAQRNQYGD